MFESTIKLFTCLFNEAVTIVCLRSVQVTDLSLVRSHLLLSVSDLAEYYLSPVVLQTAQLLPSIPTLTLDQSGRSAFIM